MKLKTIWVLALTAAIFMLAAGCAGSGGESSGDETEMTYQTAPPALKFDISTLLTGEQVKNAFGRPVGAPIVTDEDTSVRYSEVDGNGLDYVEIVIEEDTRARFDEIVASIPDLTDTPNLGDAAKWGGEDGQGQLLCYSKGHMIQITVSDHAMSGDKQLTCARELAAHVMEAIR